MLTTPPVISGAPAADPFPPLNSCGGPVNPKAFVENSTGSTVILAYIAMSLGFLIGGLATMGIAWLALLLAPLIDYFNRRKAMALLRGSGIQVNAQQFPEIHNCAVSFAQRLGMQAAPEVYIVEGNLINAAAMKVGGRKVVVLVDDVVDACLRSGDPQTLAFILAHEMAHHALGHTGLIRAMLTTQLRKLSRLDEFSCDAVANQLVGDPTISAKALVTLLSGPQLMRYVNLNQLYLQASEVATDKHSVKAERHLSHPLLLRRIQRFLVA